MVTDRKYKKVRESDFQNWPQIYEKLKKLPTEKL